MKIAAFNLENLFDRARAFNEKDNDLTKSVINGVAEMNCLFEQDVYSDASKERMLQLVKEFDFDKYDKGPLVLVRKIRGKIFYRPRSGGISVVASGRSSWVGWAELRTGPVDEIAVMNTGRVIRDVDADILAVVEAENRIALKQFTEFVFDRVKDEIPTQVQPYTHIMLIDGNDDRGIDVGLMTKEGYDIGLMQSHVHDLKDDGYPIFSRDCPEYSVKTPIGTIWVLPNHFKSKFGGNDPASIAKREAQASEVAKIYNRLRSEGHDKVVVLGDFNDTPDSEPLQPLLANTDLLDVSEHEEFDTGEFKGRAGTDERGYGTHGLGNDGDKLDYLLLSPELFGRVTKAGLFRKGAWPGSRPKRWTVYDELEREEQVASDHHVIWAEIKEND